jgi:hypothetical protein
MYILTLVAAAATFEALGVLLGYIIDGSRGLGRGAAVGAVGAMFIALWGFVFARLPLRRPRVENGTPK